ncbi:MAG: hypothetical protein ACPH8B_02890 [Candidatus Puniceispirillum sp.]
MILKCPHCDDEANIPNALSHYENMPIACHACGGFFFAPPPDPHDPAPRHQGALPRSNRQIECAACHIPVLIPDIDAADARHKFSCPACHADLPPLPVDIKSMDIKTPEIKSEKISATDEKPSSKTLRASRPDTSTRKRTSISFLAIAIAIGIGVGVALGVLLSQNMIALDLDTLAELASQTGQQLVHFWHQTLARLSAAI